MVAWYRMDLEIHHLDRGQALASFGPVMIRVVTTAPSDLASLEQQHRLTEAALARWPMIGWWVILHHGSPFPDSDFLRRAGPSLRPHRDRIVNVITPLGLGFWASTAFAMVGAMAKLVGQQAFLETSLERGSERLGLELIGVDAERLAATHAELIGAVQTSAKVA